MQGRLSTPQDCSKRHTGKLALQADQQVQNGLPREMLLAPEEVLVLRDVLIGHFKHRCCPVAQQPLQEKGLAEVPVGAAVMRGNSKLDLLRLGHGPQAQLLHDLQHVTRHYQ